MIFTAIKGVIQKKMLISLATALLLQGTINQITAASLYPSDKSEKSNKEVRKSSKGFLFFKKKQKEEQQMRDSIQIGDEITTIGGIMGRVVTVKEDSIVLETGADRVKMKFQRWAIQTNNTANERMEAERKAAADAKKAQSEKAAIDKAVNGKSKKSKKVENIGAADEMKAEEEAKMAEEKTEE